MRNYILFFVLILSSISIFGQSFSALEVVYTHTNATSPSGFDVYLKVDENIAEFLYHRKANSFTNDQGLRINVPFYKYVNQYEFNSNQVTENRELEDGTILYSEWYNDLEWTITDEQKNILGFTVTKAYTTSMESSPKGPFYYGKTIAWFTNDIPIAAGPARYYGLPGLILELTYESSSIQYIAKEINYLDEDFIPKTMNKKNKVEKLDVVYFLHKNPREIKRIQRRKK